MQNNQKKDTQLAQETVLLRHPLPKYSFAGKKLNKPIVEKIDGNTPKTVSSDLSASKDTAVLNSNTSDLKNIQNAHESKEILAAQNPVYSWSSSHNFQWGSVGRSDPPTLATALPPCGPLVTGSYQTYSANLQKPVQLPNKPISQVDPVRSQSMASVSPVCNGASKDPVSDTQLYLQKLEQELNLSNFQVRLPKNVEAELRKENESLKSQLDVQLQVNSELKRLLVASVGEDLEVRVERLARDKAELSVEVGGFTKKVTQDYENLDKISIQADMWRSKFLASRVMIEELGSARAFYALQYQESQDALQQLLNERHELRVNLMEAYKCLQQVKSAFDPLNTHRSSTLASTNVLDLARKSQQLAEAIRFRLLPGNLGPHTVIDFDEQLQNTMTQAESFAQQLVSKQVNPESLPNSSLFGPKTPRIDRFHPEARFDNLTFNCCVKCKGELKVM